MCLILLSHGEHAQYKLVVAANRDEFYHRPALPADFWQDHPSILGGIDLTAGGTWMGVNKKGKIAMLTNYRDLSNLKKDAPSRGHLVSDFLKNGMNSVEYLESIPSNGSAYNGYNLIVGTGDQLYYQSNYQEGIHQITPGKHGLSNALLDSPWPKVKEGVGDLSEILDAWEIKPSEVFEAMYNEKTHPDSDLPNTGVGIEMERMLSAMFIKSPNYGSRCTTLILIDYHNKLSFHERTYNTHNFSYTEKHYQFEIE